MVVGMNESRGGIGGLLARGTARGMDLLEAVPTIIVALVVVSFFGTSTPTMVLTLAIVLAPLQARLVRTEVLRVRHDAYLDAARQAGLTELELVVRHVLPNSVTPAFQNAPVLFGVTIILTAALGFLGVGLPPPTPEWGAMITRGAGDAAVGKFWAAGAPAVALCLTVASVSLLGRRLTADLRR
nr:ABC transporter permease [Kineococcus aurantiacus]